MNSDHPENTRQRGMGTRFRLADTNGRDRYSKILHDIRILRQEWLVEEYRSGRINEKQFLEALLIKTPDRRWSTVATMSPADCREPTTVR